MKVFIASKLAELGFESVSKDLKAHTGSHDYSNQGKLHGGSDTWTHPQELSGFACLEGK